MKAIAIACAVVLLAAASSFAAGEGITVSVATTQPGAEIPADMIGLSYETSRMLPDKDGTYYFRPDNKALVAMFETLGVKSLRIGGNSVDDPKIPIPSEADVRAFFEFAKAAGVKVIYSVRLEDGDPASAGMIARLIHDNYPDILDSFAIGNEPSYYKDYQVYRPKWAAIRDAIVAADPDARFSGPDQNPSPELCKNMVRDFGNAAGRLVQITQHSYPFGCAYKNPKEGQKDVTKLVPFPGPASRDKMLSPAAYEIYEKIRKEMADAVSRTSLTYRLSETNSYWFSGLEGASDSYVSALWGVDYLHWWAAHGAEGLNFHNGDRTGGSVSLPCHYAVFVTTDHGYEARPLAYGIKLFDLGGHGKQLPLTVSSSPEQGVVAYAALDEDGAVCVTIINKAHDKSAAGTNVQIKLDVPSSNSDAKVIFLEAKDNDIAGGSSDVMLGDAPIQADGIWNGQWKSLKPTDGGLVVTMPPASAAVVKVVPGR